jgi:uncharacterized membrane protein
MDLVESYLVEVRRYLLDAQRDDIVEELRETLEEQVHDHAEGCGRSPQREDELAVLSILGHPLKVASGYREQRYLLGPALFPTYVQTLKLVVSIALIAQFLVGFAAASVAGWDMSIGDALWALINMVLWAVAVVTLVFVAIEYSGEKLNWYDSWTPESLSAGAASVVDRTAS